MRDHCSMGGTAVSLNLSPGFQEFDLFVVGQNARLCCTFNTPIGSPSLGLVTVTLIFWPPLWFFGCHLYFLAVSLTATLIFWLSPWIQLSLWFYDGHFYFFAATTIQFLCISWWPPSFDFVTLIWSLFLITVIFGYFCHSNFVTKTIWHQGWSISIHGKIPLSPLLIGQEWGGWGDLCTVV